MLSRIAAPLSSPSIAIVATIALVGLLGSNFSRNSYSVGALSVSNT
jgi:hypothetical protein